MILTSWPFWARYNGRALATSARPPVFTSPSTSEATNRIFSGLIANSCSLRYHDDTAFGYGKPLSVMVQILTDHGAGCNFNVFVDDGAANGATFADFHIPQQHGFTDVAAGAYVAAKSQYGSLDLAALNEAATGDQG